MGRLYSIGFTDQSLTSAQGLFLLNVPTGTTVAIRSIEVGQRTIFSFESHGLKLLRMSTASTGGSAASPQPLNTNDPASVVGAGAKVGPYTVNGTVSATLYSAMWHLLNGWFYLPLPDERIIVSGGTAFEVALASAPSVSTLISGNLIYEEL